MSATKDDDRPPVHVFVATALAVGKMISLRGQPLNRADIAECVDHAFTLVQEVERNLNGA